MSVIKLNLNMPMSAFGNSSHNNINKTDTSLNVQKPYLRTNYIEGKMEEDLDLKNQKRIKNLPDPVLEKQLQKISLMICSMILV